MTIKKIAFIFFLFVIACSVKAITKQFVPYGSYYNTYSGKNHALSLYTARSKVYTLFVSAMPAGQNLENGGFSLNESVLPKFIDALEAAKIEYQALIQKAKENKQKRADIPLELTCTTDVFFIRTKCQMQYYDQLSFNFVVREHEGQVAYMLFVNTGTITSSTDATITSDGFQLVFTQPSEVDDFVQKISTAKINDFIAASDTAAIVAKKKKEDNYLNLINRCPIVAHLSFGIKAGYANMFGMNKVDISIKTPNVPASITPDLSLGFQFGIFGRVEYKNLLFQPEISYLTGAQKNLVGMRLVGSSNSYKTDFIQETDISSLDIPLLIGYELLTNVNSSFRILAGPKIRLNVGSDSKLINVIDRESSTQDKLIFHTDPFKIGLEAGCEFDYRSFTFGVRYNAIADSYHTTFLLNSKSNNFDPNQANSILFSIGYKLFEPMNIVRK